VLSLH